MGVLLGFSCKTDSLWEGKASSYLERLRISSTVIFPAATSLRFFLVTLSTDIGLSPFMMGWEKNFPVYCKGHRQTEKPKLTTLEPTIIFEWSVPAWITCEAGYVFRVSFSQANNFMVAPCFLFHESKILPPCSPIAVSMIPLPKTRIECMTHPSHSLFARTVLTRLTDSEGSTLCE